MIFPPALSLIQNHPSKHKYPAPEVFLLLPALTLAFQSALSRALGSSTQTNASGGEEKITQRCRIEGLQGESSPTRGAHVPPARPDQSHGSAGRRMSLPADRLSLLSTCCSPRGVCCCVAPALRLIRRRRRCCCLLLLLLPFTTPPLPTVGEEELQQHLALSRPVS